MTDHDHPLSMTVHSMPEPAVGDQQDPARTRKGRVWMLIVFLICAAPVVASYFTYYVIQPKGDPRFGELIQPSRGLPDAVPLEPVPPDTPGQTRLPNQSTHGVPDPAGLPVQTAIRCVGTHRVKFPTSGERRLEAHAPRLAAIVRSINATTFIFNNGINAV